MPTDPNIALLRSIAEELESRIAAGTPEPWGTDDHYPEYVYSNFGHGAAILHCEDHISENSAKAALGVNLLPVFASTCRWLADYDCLNCDDGVETDCGVEFECRACAPIRAQRAVMVEQARAILGGGGDAKS